MLSSGDFPAFFAEVHGVEPFPWQRRLLERVVTDGWPARLDLPTASGKSAVVDVAVFALALSVGSGRREPRRVFFVVDRRMVVDDVSTRAKAIARALDDSTRPVSAAVAERLRRLGGEVPLRVATLRGGMYLDHGWARDPAQPLVCVSTVDQVGSRLLFRGYGLLGDATNQLPIHAGMVANDALIVLDEVHLAGAFARTLEAIARYRTWGEVPSSPWQVVEMSATPIDDGITASDFGLTDADREHPMLGPRLRASKPARLVQVEDDANDPQPHLARALAEQALDLRARNPELRVIGVVVNRVRTARLVFERLRKQPETDAVLLIGRVRPWDRESLLQGWLPRLRPDRPEDDTSSPVFVVTTQCIETGADLDFDALVTECASLEALRQRFGRLNRAGRRERAPAVILARPRSLREANDPIYGPALSHTWRWLLGKAQRVGRGRHREAIVDLGIEATRALLADLDEGQGLAVLGAPTSRPPVLLPTHLDLLAQTSPLPEPDIEVSLFLHGVDPSPADVQVVWRGDLPPLSTEGWADIIALAPPSSREAIALPTAAVRRWLSGEAPVDVADVERTSDLDRGVDDRALVFRPCLRWRGPRQGGTAVIEPAQIRPGDTIVVPCDYGGADVYGWYPESHRPVVDIAEATSARPLLRLHPSLLRWQLKDPSAAATAQLRDLIYQLVRALADDEPVEELERQILESLADDTLAVPWICQRAMALLRDPRRGRVPYPDGAGIVLTQSRRPVLGIAPSETITDESDETSLVGEVPLGRHQEGVAERATWFATACGLPPELVADLRLAARHHDLGKRDPAFQLLLQGGDPRRVQLAPEPLAKGVGELRSPAAWREAWRRSGLPVGHRHEAVSLTLLGEEELAGAHDPELVRHLVASHHGCARPFFPVPEGSSLADPVVRLDGGVAERFWALTRRYGWYGLAYLEAILRLADHRQSESEAAG